MAKRDYYTVLGVNRDAGDDEIKKSLAAIVARVSSCVRSPRNSTQGPAALHTAAYPGSCSSEPTTASGGRRDPSA